LAIGGFRLQVLHVPCGQFGLIKIGSVCSSGDALASRSLDGIIS